MCQRATCPNCQRPTYKGCGMHIEQVLGDVPVDERCRCAETATVSEDRGPRSWFSRRG